MSNLNSSISTIFALVNSMIGGTMITLPILFLKSGIITGILVLLVSGWISYKTCRIYVIHLGNKDRDVQDSVRRILSARWQKFFMLITGYYLVFLNIIYIELIIDQLYDIIYYILYTTGHSDWIAEKGIKSLVFDKFSIQYLSLICFLPLLSIIFIKNLGFLIKLTSFGVISVGIYLCFLTYEFFANLGDIDTNQIVWVSSDLGNLAGSCALAFTIHTVVASIVKANKNQQKNQRDLKISYLLGFFIYTFIGTCGCLSVLTNPNCKITIIDCFLNDWQVLVVQISYLIGLVTVYPCFLEVGRSRLLLSHFSEITPKLFRLFNLTFIIIAILFSFLSPYLPLDLIMNLVGSILCFFFVYLIPGKMHIECLYNTIPKEDESLLGSAIQSQKQIDNKCFHDQKQGKKYPKRVRQYLYIFINVIGIAIGIYGIYQFFQTLLS